MASKYGTSHVIPPYGNFLKVFLEHIVTTTWRCLLVAPLSQLSLSMVGSPNRRKLYANESEKYSCRHPFIISWTLHQMETLNSIHVQRICIKDENWNPTPCLFCKLCLSISMWSIPHPSPILCECLEIPLAHLFLCSSTLE